MNEMGPMDAVGWYRRTHIDSRGPNVQSKEVNDAVIEGRYRYCVAQTDVSRLDTSSHTGQGAKVWMVQRQYRKKALRNFLAFKEVAQRHREEVLEGV